jgi:hypothetical protein
MTLAVGFVLTLSNPIASQVLAGPAIPPRITTQNSLELTPIRCTANQRSACDERLRQCTDDMSVASDLRVCKAQFERCLVQCGR